MILAYNNLLKDAAISTNSEDANYPLKNLCHKWKKRVFKSNIVAPYIAVEFDSPQEIDSFIMMYHNVNKIEVQYHLGINLVGTLYRDIIHESIVADRMTIYLESPEKTEIGLLYIGPSFNCGKSADQDMPLISTDVPTFSSDGQVGGRRGSVLRGGTIEIPLLTSEQREEIELAYKYCGLIEPFFLDLWDGFEPIYGVFTSDLSVTHHADGDTVRFDFREVN